MCPCCQQYDSSSVVAFYAIEFFGLYHLRVSLESGQLQSYHTLVCSRYSPCSCVSPRKNYVHFLSLNFFFAMSTFLDAKSLVEFSVDKNDEAYGFFFTWEMLHIMTDLLMWIHPAHLPHLWPHHKRYKQDDNIKFIIIKILYLVTL